MEIEIGIQNVAHTVSFETDQTAEEIAKALDEGTANGTNITLTDSKGRTIVVSGKAFGYARFGSETSRPVGFGI
jgi:hypothetical protein